MSKHELSRRDLIKLGLTAGAATVVGTPAFASSGSSTSTTGNPCGQAIEVFPTSPLILEPFKDSLPIPRAMAPTPTSEVATWSKRPGPGVGQQDSYGYTHQLWTNQLGLPDPLIYRIKLQVNTHNFTSSPVMT